MMQMLKGKSIGSLLVCAWAYLLAAACVAVGSLSASWKGGGGGGGGSSS